MASLLLFLRSPHPTTAFPALRSWPVPATSEEEIAGGWRYAEFTDWPEDLFHAAGALAAETGAPVLAAIVAGPDETFVFGVGAAPGRHPFLLYLGTDHALAAGMDLQGYDLREAFAECEAWSAAAGLHTAPQVLTDAFTRQDGQGYRHLVALLSGLGVPEYAEKDPYFEERGAEPLVIDPVLLVRSPSPARGLAAARQWPGGLGRDEYVLRDGWRAACPADWPREEEELDRVLTAFATETRCPALVAQATRQGFVTVRATDRPGHVFPLMLGLEAAQDAGYCMGVGNRYAGAQEIVQWARAAGLRTDDAVLRTAFDRPGGRDEGVALVLVLLRGLGVPGTEKVDPYWDGRDPAGDGPSFGIGISVSFGLGF